MAAISHEADASVESGWEESEDSAGSDDSVLDSEDESAIRQMVARLEAKVD